MNDKKKKKKRNLVLPYDTCRTSACCCMARRDKTNSIDAICSGNPGLTKYYSCRDMNYRGTFRGMGSTFSFFLFLRPLSVSIYYLCFSCPHVVLPRLRSKKKKSVCVAARGAGTPGVSKMVTKKKSSLGTVTLNSSRPLGCI